MLAAAAFLAAPAASAESLNAALAAAYRYNPRLDAERARLRATDEEVARANSRYRPTISGSADVNYEYQKSKFSAGGTGSASGISELPPVAAGKDSTTLFPSGYSLNLSQNIFDGFQTTSGVREAEALVRASREQLRDVEQQVLLEAVTVYMNVVRDQAIVNLAENNVRVLTEQLKATRDRFAVGEVTRTDVAQAEARLAQAKAGAVAIRVAPSLTVAQANLKTSRADYQRVIGHPPAGLTEQRTRDNLLPKSLPEAKAAATRESPLLVSALYREQSARYTVDRIRGELLPQARLEASYGQRFDQTESLESTEQATVSGRVTVPIYQGGEVYARLRQAKQTHISLLQEIERARSEAEASATSAWAQYEATRARIDSDRKQVEANRIALNGVKEEERVGQRTVLDVLNAQQELLDAEAQLVITKRDLVVNSYTLLSAVGRLNAANLGIASHVYDPQAHYSEVRDQWFGADVTRTARDPERAESWETRTEPEHKRR